MNSRQLAALLVISVIWGASFLFIRVLVTAGIEPTGVSGARSALGAVSLLPFAYALRSKFPRDRRTWALMAGLGILNFALPWTLFSIGQRHVPSGVGSIANSAQPLWAAIFSVALIKGDALGRTKSFGLLLGFAGVVVLMSGRIRGLDSESLQGIPPMILATVLYGISAVSIRKWLRHVPAVQLTFVQIGVAGCLLLPIALATGAYDNASMAWHEWASLLTLGFVSSGVVAVLYMWMIAEVGPVRAGIATYLMPPVGVFLGWLLLDEGVGWSMLAGLALIFAGVGVVQGRVRTPRWWSTKRKPEPVAAPGS